MSPLLLVTRREITEKLRSKAFRIVNGIIVGLVLLATILPGLLADDGPSTFTLGVVGDGAATVGAVAEQQAAVFGAELELTTLPDEAAARTAVEEGDVELALLEGDRLLATGDVTGDRIELLENARRLAGLDGALADAGVDADERSQLLAPPPLDVEVVGEQDTGPSPDPVALTVGLAASAALYGLLIFYGQQIAQGLVQEKQSRVIEVLLATVRPIDLLGGKLLGLGLLGLAQLVLMAVAGYVGLLVSGGGGSVPPAAIGTLGALVPWFLLGYALYATLFALAAALVPRIEDLQTAMTVPIILLIGGFFLTQFTITDPDGTMGTIAAVLPFSAPIAQPLRPALGASNGLLTVIGAVSTIATTAVLVPFAARVHAGAALSTRSKIGIREALRRGRE